MEHQGYWLPRPPGLDSTSCLFLPSSFTSYLFISLFQILYSTLLSPFATVFLSFYFSFFLHFLPFSLFFWVKSDDKNKSWSPRRSAGSTKWNHRHKLGTEPEVNRCPRYFLSKEGGHECQAVHFGLSKRVRNTIPWNGLLHPVLISVKHPSRLTH